MNGLNVLYEDNHLLFVEKPPNMPVQADASGDMDLLTMAKRYVKTAGQKPGEAYLALTHRLDRPVGGVMVFCKTGKAAGRVSAQIRDNALTKIYLAVADGSPPGGELRDYLIKDSQTNMSRVCEPDKNGAKLAILSYETTGANAGLSLVKITLKTGRPHQIRVQLANAGFPIWGDNRYGRGRPGQQIALWAHSLTLTHPTKGVPVTVTSAPPAAHPWDLFG